MTTSIGGCVSLFCMLLCTTSINGELKIPDERACPSKINAALYLPPGREQTHGRQVCKCKCTRFFYNEVVYKEVLLDRQKPKKN